MKLYIYFIGVLFFCSYVQATSCLTDDETLKKLSLEKKDAFDISISETQDDTMLVIISAPEKINDVRIKGITASGKNSQGKINYFFSIGLNLEKNRIVSAYEINSNLVDGSYIQFSYEKCGMVFTYPLIAKELLDNESK